MLRVYLVHKVLQVLASQDLRACKVAKAHQAPRVLQAQALPVLLRLLQAFKVLQARRAHKGR